ncbi:MAG: pyridoxamine kinase [Clostridia bacterium]|nr:pyridoxamine kinase [Clostridia bacterium]
MQKRIAAIHDLSCFGKCSLTVALPIVSCMGIECAVLPTALLSGHFAALPEVSVLDLSHRMGLIAEQWAKGDVTFDGIFSGYLGSASQVEQVQAFVRQFRGTDTIFVADPAMADRGRLYRGFEMNHVEAMTRLCAGADVTLPNVTEACLMLGEDYRDQHDRAYVEKLVRGLLELGAGAAVVTGVCLNDETVGIACCSGGDVTFFHRPRVPGHFNGTGDIFASVFTASLVRGGGFLEAAEKAMDFTSRVIAGTVSNPDHRPYGVDLEQHLHLLWE